MWVASVCVQAVWHAMGAVPVSESKRSDVLRDGPISWKSCLQQVTWELETWNVSGWDQRCYWQSSPAAAWSLVMALLSVWWNPKLKFKIRRSNVRMTGLGEHMSLQIFVLAIRTIAWWALHDKSRSILPQQAFQGANAFMVALLITVSHLPPLS